MRNLSQKHFLRGVRVVPSAGEAETKARTETTTYIDQVVLYELRTNKNYLISFVMAFCLHQRSDNI